MKGLLLKDLYMIWKNFRIYFVICLAFLFIGVWSSNSFFFVYPAVMGSMVPINILSFDEKSGWDRYSLAFPVSRARLVASKYLISLICSGSMLLLCSLFMVGKIFFISHDTEMLDAFLPTLLVMMFLPPAVVLPCIFKFGSQKGSLAYILVFGVVFGVGYAVTQVAGLADLGSFPSVIAFLPLATAALYALSWPLSIRIYKRKEF